MNDVIRALSKCRHVFYKKNLPSSLTLNHSSISIYQRHRTLTNSVCLWATFGDKEVRHWNEKKWSSFEIICFYSIPKNSYKHSDQPWQCWCMQTRLLRYVQIFSHNLFSPICETIVHIAIYARQSRSRRPRVWWTRSSAKADCISNGRREPLFTRQCTQQEVLGKGVNSLVRLFFKY